MAALYGGPTGNAGALGSMPVPGPGGAPRQLIDIASIAMLEKALNAKGRRRLASVDLAARLGRPRRGARPLDRLGRQWPRLRHRRGIVGDRLPGGGDRRLDAGRRCAPASSRRSATRCTKIDAEGLTLPPVREGTVGIHARALGGASLPLSDRFLVGATAAVRLIG